MKKIISRALTTFLVLAILVSSALCVSAATKTYADVKSGDWFAEFVNYMSDKGIINGYTDNTFRPNNEVKRSEFIKMMVETFGLDIETSINYTDVSSGDWFYPYYRKAASQGFITEVYQSSKTMSPSKPLQRQEAAALLMAYLSYPEGEKASSSSFSDYSSINSDYRDWVLQAVKAEIINGFTDGTFRPTATLTRAQAAKILAVAAGTISGNDDVDALENFSDNLTITGPCTVSGVTINGNVIISEGITSGTVSLVGCNVKGTIYDRSNGTLVINGGEVKQLDVNALGAAITLKSDVSVDLMNINEYSTVTLSSAAIKKIKTNESAKKATVTGNGTVTDIDVKADGFMCGLVPVNTPTVADGISAVIGGVSYNGGFIGTPNVVWTNDKEYLSCETYKAGTVRFYFSVTSSVPAKTAFSGNYSSADYKGEFTVAKNSKSKELLSSSAAIKLYPYLVVAFSDGTGVNTPVVIDRERMQNAFSVAPVLSVSGTSEQLKYAARQNGTVYYYYTLDSAAPEKFSYANTAYNDAYMKGSFTVSSTATTTKTLREVSDVDAYSHVVVFFKGTANEEFAPVIIERTETANGFKVDPEWLYSDKDKEYKLTYKLSKAGSVKYFYTNLSSNFTSANFDVEYKRLADENKTGMYGTSGNLKVDSTEYKLDANPSIYLIVMFTETNGTKHSPVKLTLKMEGNGFKTTPTVFTSSVAGRDYISIEPEYNNGTVKGMYVNQNQAYTSESFMKAYASAAPEMKFEKSLAFGSITNFTKEIPQKSGAFIAFMFTSNEGNTYVPVVVSKKTGGIGFNGNPTVTITLDTLSDSSTTMIKGDAYTSIKLTYFGENNATLVSQITADSFDRLGQGSLRYSRLISVSEFKEGVALDDLSQYKYIAIRASFECGGETLNFAPFIITPGRIDYGVEVASLTVNEGNVQVNLKALGSGVNVNGKLNFCFANTIPATADEFRTLYSKTPSTATGSALIVSSTKDFLACRMHEIVDYKYFVYLFEDGNGTYTPYYANNISDSELQLNSYTDESENKLVFTAFIQNYKIAWFYSKNELKDLTVSTFKSTYSSTSSSNKGTTAEVNETSQFTGTINVPKKDANKAYLYFCVIDSQNNYYKPIMLALPAEA